MAAVEVQHGELDQKIGVYENDRDKVFKAIPTFSWAAENEVHDLTPHSEFAFGESRLLVMSRLSYFSLGWHTGS